MEQKTNKYWVVIPAAGFGARMQSGTPKQYLKIATQTILDHTLRVFLDMPTIAGVVVALASDDNIWPSSNYAEHSKVQTCLGGDERYQTVQQALSHLQNQIDENDWVLVHDAARCGIQADDLTRLITTVGQHAVGGILALPVADTMKRVDDNQHIIETVSRDSLWQAQTPQMFRYGLLKQALDNVTKTVTDEAQAVEQLGKQPMVVLGSKRNFKVTYPEDLTLMESYLCA